MSQSIPHWDLSNVYPGLDSDELRQALSRLAGLIDDLDGYLSAHDIRQGSPSAADGPALAAVCGGWLDRSNEVQRLGHTLRSFLYAYVTTDSYNKTARRLMSQLDPLLVRLERQEVAFRGWIGTVAEEADRFAALLAQPGVVGEHAFFLREAAEQSRYLMSEAEEGLAAELGLSGARAWEKLHGVVTSQLKVPLERGGRVEALPVTVVQNLKTDRDEAVRRSAHQAEVAAWHSVSEPLAACLNGVKGTVNTLNTRRGRSDALHAALDQSRIDRETLEAMLGAVRDSFPAFRRYFRAKARLLGKEALAWWDLAAPVGTAMRRYSYAQAREFILAQFGTFSGRLADFAAGAFERNWIDAEPRDGKRGGAFCTALPAVEESRVLCNFDGSPNQVLTLAHELGHAYHNECHRGKTPLQRRTPMTMAETASIFNETIITDALLAQASGDEDTLAMLETFLMGAAQVVVDIYSRYLFETEVFVRRAEAELSADDLCEAMVRAQQATYGDGLDPAALNPYMWAWKPHYYQAGRSFYNFPYTFGLLFGLGLYAIYQERGPAFRGDYDRLLESTGEDKVAELAARFGIDVRRPAFWQSSLRIIEERIDRYGALQARLPRP